MTRPSVYVAPLITELPEPYVPSTRVRCARCGFDVWVDPLRFTPVKASEPSTRVICLACAQALGELL